MNQQDAIALLRAAIPSADTADGEVWADLGAGSGMFTRALAAIIGPAGRVIAVDRDARGLASIRTWAARQGEGATIDVIEADVAVPLDLPPLDGVVMANVLHFIGDASSALRRVATHLRPGGRLVLIEYEGRRPNPWVPHPVSAARFAELAAEAGLTPPRVVATRPSAYGGELYVAVAERES
jgi:ubiquinone/menaquinone biosynthesis C-methylase UbiE